MINFPDSPTNGQVFTSGSTSWIYDGVKWGLNTNVAVSNDSMPVGSILWYANTTSAPPGWIAADGSAVSRTTYATLFSTIGTTYGSGDGSTTFNVPSVAATTGKYYIRYTTSLGTVTTTSLSTAPVGTMLDWPTTSSYPTGYLRADGSAVSRTSYADLFSLIGTTYGTGDGSTTFNLPNLVAAGTGSPVKIIKASLGGIVEPSTVSHASSHIRGGSDIIDADRDQIDFIPTYYTRDSSPSQAGALTDLTAHLKGIDNKFNTPNSLFVSRDQNWTATINNPSSYQFPVASGLQSSFTKRSSSSILLCNVRAQLEVTSGGGNGYDFTLLLGAYSFNTYSPSSVATSRYYINNTFPFTGVPAGTYATNIQMSAWGPIQLTFAAYNAQVSYSITEIG